MKIFGLLLAVVMMAVGATAAFAAGTAKPYRVVSSEELKALLDADTKGLVIIDARSPQEYEEVHIRTAVSIPLTLLEMNSGLLAVPKDAKLVFYCNGIKCGKSGKSAKIAVEQGYRDVAVYADGMPVWEEKGYAIYAGPTYEKKIETTRIKPRDLKELLDSKAGSITVVDVRDPKEFSEGHIPGAINIPVTTFAAGSGVLDKGKRVVVYCNSGGRSYNAYRKLQKLAYPTIAQAIFADWKDANLPVEK
ncbi:MAG TPA: rhodanese-like domain-containing protein [Geobacteraceae bacterium]